MSIRFLIVLLFSSFTLWSQSKSDVIIDIKNPDEKNDRIDELAEVSWLSLVAKNPAIKVGGFKVVDVKTGVELPYQLTYEGTSDVKQLLVQISIPAGSTRQIAISNGKPAVVESKVYGRYVPERKDDFAWENDKIAFRMYGKALEGTNENAYGIDVWAKRTTNLIIDKWYKTGDYHADHGDGLDYYSVGLTLGGGDIAPYVNDKIAFPKNYRNWKVLDKGPLRFTFELGYDEWDAGDMKLKVVKKISLDAGSQLNKVEATFSFTEGSKPLNAVIGIVKRKEPGTIKLDEKGSVAGYWEPIHGNDGVLGLGSITSEKSERMLVSNDHLLTLVKVHSGKPLVYYNGAAWSKAGMIKTSEDWFEYLNVFNERLKKPLIISLK